MDAVDKGVISILCVLAILEIYLICKERKRKGAGYHKNKKSGVPAGAIIAGICVALITFRTKPAIALFPAKLNHNITSMRTDENDNTKNSQISKESSVYTKETLSGRNSINNNPTLSPTVVPTVTPTAPPLPTATLTVTQLPTEAPKLYSDERIPNIGEMHIDTTKYEIKEYKVKPDNGRYGEYTIRLTIYTDEYEYFHSLGRYYTSQRYYHYIQEKTNKKYISVLTEYLKEICDYMGLTSDGERVREVINFVQSINYAYDIDSTGYDDWPKYPIETLWDREGDCEDSSILLAALLREMGYGCSFITYPDHCAIGVLGSDVMPGTYFTINDDRYYYVETTSSGWEIGQLPDRYKNESAKVNIIP